MWRLGYAARCYFGLAKLTQPDEAAEDSNSPTITRGSEPGVALGTFGYWQSEWLA